MIEIHTILKKILRNEKIVFRDMPLTENCATELVTQYLSDHPHINVLSDVHYAHITDERGRLTRYRSGDRYVFVESDFTPSLSTNTQIGQYNVRVKQGRQTGGVRGSQPPLNFGWGG